MGTGASTSPRSRYSVRRPPCSNGAVNGFEEAASPFASPPIVWPSEDKVSSPSSAARWRASSCSASSPQSTKTCNNAEAEEADLERAEGTHMVVNTEGSMKAFGDNDAEGYSQNRTQHAENASAMSLRSAATAANFSRPSLAKGSSALRPRWKRPQRSTLASASQDDGWTPRSTSTSGLQMQDDEHPQPLTDGLPCGQSDHGVTPAERLAKLTLERPDYLGFMAKDVGEPPPTPSTISNHSLSCTQSSWSSGSAWSSRPSTRSSAHTSSNLHGSREVFPEDERFHILLDCTSDSRLRACGDLSANVEGLRALSSVKTAWGSDEIEEA